MNARPILELDHLVKTYRSPHGLRRVLDSVDLTLREGELAIVTGKSGTGKSTLLNLIGGLDRTYEGTIRMAGHDLRGLDDANLSRLRGTVAGFVFQTPVFLDHLTAEKNLRFSAAFAGKTATREAISDLLADLEIREVGPQLPSQLSGGQLQRLALARALMGDPPLLLCDEPTGNLDRETGEALIALLHRLNKAGKTLIVVTHDERFALSEGRHLVLHEGRLEEGGAS